MKKKSMFPWAVLGLVALSQSIVSGLQAAELVKVSGVVKGITTKDKDNLVDGALVLPTLSAEDLFQFQIDQFMGPGEEMTVGGLFKASVPSNFYFPQQKEKYGFFPVGFGKEHFSIMAMPGDKKELVAAWFQIPFDKLIDMNQNGTPPTALLPLIQIKKHSFATEQDWATVPSINLNLDRDLGPAVAYSWKRSALTGNDMDSLFLFQGTKTNRWAFANLKGNPATSGKLESLKGLEDSFKLLFMRTHVTDKDVTSAEGYVRTAKLATPVIVENVPPALDAKLLANNKIEWSPIQNPGWMSLVMTLQKLEQRLFVISGFFGQLFAQSPESEQFWLDPKTGSADTQLGSNDMKDLSLMLAFVGTDVEVPMPAEGQDNTAFVNAASEIRMKKLK